MNLQESADLDPTEVESVTPKLNTEAGDTQTQYKALESLDAALENSYASFSARFAALLIDTTVVGYLTAFVYRLFGERLRLPALEWTDPVSLISRQQLPWVAVIAGLIFAYFFLFEGIFGRTIGKLLCGLSVTHKHGGPPPLLGIFIRNVFRFVDIVLFPITGFGLAEISERRQRLGDLLGGTTVRRSREPGSPVQEAAQIEWGSVTRRTVALLLDLVIFAIVSLFFLLSLPINRPQLTHEILAFGPVLLIAYWVLSETIMGGTPAKLLLGLRVVDEAARPIGVAGSLLRNGFRIMDHNPLGYLCAMLSTRRQRPGDLAARSSVIRTGWSVRRLIALVLSLAIITGLGYYGTRNPNSFIRQERILKIGPWTVPDLPSQFKYYLGLRLRISSFRFGQANAPAAAEEPLYIPGEIVYLTADVSGYILKDDTAWLQQDVLVTDPTGETLIDLLNVINKRYPSSESGVQRMTSSFLLPLRIAMGNYRVQIRIRDRYGNMIGETENTFLVK